MKRFHTLMPVFHFLTTTAVAACICYWTTAIRGAYSASSYEPQNLSLPLIAAVMVIGGFPFAIAAWINYRKSCSTLAVFLVGSAWQWGGPILENHVWQTKGFLSLACALILCFLLTHGRIARPVREWAGYRAAIANLLCVLWMLILVFLLFWLLTLYLTRH